MHDYSRPLARTRPRAATLRLQIGALNSDRLVLLIFNASESKFNSASMLFFQYHTLQFGFINLFVFEQCWLA